jgi:hypothetical protein
VPQGDGAAVDVDDLFLDAELLDAVNGLGRKGFIQLDQLDLVQPMLASFSTLGMATAGPTPMYSGGTPPPREP